ncbi:MAG: glycosyl hydrolase [bacterium]|nr:glycosyl hydrolase [bacterium]
MKNIILAIASFIIFLPVMASAQEVLPVVDSYSTDFISVIETEPYSSTFAIYGENFNYLLGGDVSVWLGPFEATSIAGNSTGMNITITVDHSLLERRNATYELVIKNTGEPVVIADKKIQIFDPFLGSYKKQRVKRYLNHTPHVKKSTKRTVGLNVHWALGSNANDDEQFASKLDSSNTKWAREHFSYKLIMGDDSSAWLKRYDQTMLKYKDRNMRVVGMLAYGEASNEHHPPGKEKWQRYVTKVVKRYRNYVDVWEIWNEPDSPDYMTPNNWKTYKPILKVGSRVIRKYDKDAIVLNGAIANINDQDFIKQMYEEGKPYFDELNVHLYYCDEFRDDGEDLGRLQMDWEALNRLVSTYRKNEKIWVTEMGCSTGEYGIDDTLVRRYTKQAVKLLRSYKYTRPILLYTIRDRTYLDAYEAYFGLLQEDFTNKPVWRWYKDLRKK